MIYIIVVSIVSKDKRATIRKEKTSKISSNGLWKVSLERHPVTMHPEKGEEGAYNGISIRDVESLSVKIVTRARPFAANEKIISFQASTELSGSRFNFVDLFSDIDSAAKHTPASLSHLPPFPSSSSSLPFRCPSLDRNRSSFYSASLNFPYDTSPLFSTVKNSKKSALDNTITFS